MAVKVISTGTAPRFGTASCGESNEQPTVGLIGLPKGTALNYATNAELIAGIGAGTHFILLGKIATLAGENEETKIAEGSAGYRSFIRSGKVRYGFTIASTIGVMNEMHKLNEGCANYDIIEIGANGWIKGHSIDRSSTTLKGFSTGMIGAGAPIESSDEAKASKALMIDYADPRETHALKHNVDPEYDVTSVNGVTLAYLDNGDTDDMFYVAVDTGELNPDNVSKLSGLEAEFVNAATGAPLTGITETPAGSGDYDAGTNTGLSITLADPIDQADDLKFASTNSVAIA